jgi:hypothetical protein
MLHGGEGWKAFDSAAKQIRARSSPDIPPLADTEKERG